MFRSLLFGTPFIDRGRFNGAGETNKCLRNFDALPRISCRPWNTDCRYLAFFFVFYFFFTFSVHAGFLYDVTGSYDCSFYFAGILITMSALLCYPLNVINKWEKKRAAEREAASA